MVEFNLTSNVLTEKYEKLLNSDVSGNIYKVPNKINKYLIIGIDKVIFTTIPLQ